MTVDPETSANTEPRSQDWPAENNTVGEEQFDSPIETADRPRWSALGLTRRDHYFLAITGGLILLISGWILFPSIGNGKPHLRLERLSHEASIFTLNINEATWVEWMQLDGIGEVTARKIVNDRDEFGPFDSVDDVQRVPSIGPSTMKKIRDHLRCPAE